MPARVRLTLLAAASLVLVAALAIVVLTGTSRHADGKTFDGALRPDTMPPSDFTLRDQDGRLVHLAAFRGRPVIVTFLYSTCRDTCPLTAQQIKGALNELHTPVPAFAVSVDPKTDTPQNAKRFILRQGLLGRLRFLLGTPAQLAPIWKAYGIQPQGAEFDHSAYVLLLDKRGHQRVAWPSDELVPEGLAHDLRLLGAR